MKRDFDPFAEDPSRPSRLTLDRFAAGELTGAERAAAQQWIAKNAYAVAHLDELRNAKKAVRPFDAMLLRARSGGLVGGERLQAAGMETFPPGMLDGKDLADLVRGAVNDEKAPVRAKVTLADDRSTQPFAEERSAEPHQQGAIEGGTPEEPETRTEPGAPSRPVKAGKPPVTPAAAAPPQPANRPMWMYLAPVAAVAAAVLIAIGVGMSGTPGENPGIRTRGPADLELRVLDGGALRAWDGKPLAAGSTVGFAVAPGEYRSVVVVSVDSTGLVSPWLPASGTGSTSLGAADAAIIPLDASVTLDATPGTEVFVAVFDRQASSVIADVSAEFRKGGATRVVAWADKAPDADAVVVEKR
jgi:hypothetical protein